MSVVQGAFAYRLAAVDLDDTLLGPDKQVSAENRAAIEALRRRGVRIMLASGRRHENMLRLHQELGLEGFLVSSQGALAKHGETGEIIHRHFVPAELAAEVVAEATAAGITILYYHEEGGFVAQRNAFTELYALRAGTPVVEAGDLRRLAGYSPQKVLWISSPEEIAQMFPSVNARYRGRLETLISEPEYIEFMAHGVTKAAGIAAVAERYGIDRTEVLAFGDGNNDVAMLAWAGLGIAMPHGQRSAQEAADRVAPPGDPETRFARAVALAIELSDGSQTAVGAAR